MRILITGGASGLGEAVTKALAANRDHEVHFTYFRSKQQAANLEQEHSNVKAVHCDFTSDESVTALLKQMEELKPEVLINNALSGVSISHFHKADSTNFLSSFQANVLPVIRVSQKAVEIFRKAKFGKMVTILSSAIINKPPIGWSGYVAEKNYLLSLSKSIATENASFNITSNCVSPGFMLTDLNIEMDERLVDDMKLKHPLKKLLTIHETAESVLFLVGANQQINGTNIVINSAADLA
ncbi:MAG: SDR family oxidoreductase [Burkholderiales bacterium]|nr:SDR family oxidoreductase [Bacteroidia bacterium]